MTNKMTDQTQAAERSHSDSPAVGFFVGAVFITLLPFFGTQLNVDINPVLTWIVGAALTAGGFWAMFKKS